MTEGDSDAAVGRRGFLGAVAGLAAAAAATGAPVAQAQSADDKRRARYQRTPHVEAFYRTARYE